MRGADPSEASLTQLAEHVIQSQDFGCTKDLLHVMSILDYDVSFLVEKSLQTMSLSDLERSSVPCSDINFFKVVRAVLASAEVVGGGFFLNFFIRLNILSDGGCNLLYGSFVVGKLSSTARKASKDSSTGMMSFNLWNKKSRSMSLEHEVELNSASLFKLKTGMAKTVFYNCGADIIPLFLHHVQGLKD
ncbi:hypothetical protein ElyMa_003827400 [Elysia marginata]|uniref:Uncharacterized protein n=1 Tax=Elysia marginata TaxID=1093978 RepID=A0AAV4FFD7_9GAST|nr:hypothetical protein ElyMa_003827400 [Elysia marginata]